MEEDEAYYFPGWTVNNFQLAKGLSDGSEPFTPLARKRMLEQVLPSPSLLNPKEAVSVMVALKRSGSDTVDGLSITTEAEYIKGERAFFNKEPYRGYSYTAKALALFASTFGTDPGYQEYRDAALATFAGTSVDWAIFNADPELPLMQKRLITHFLNTVLSATIWSEGTRIFNGADRPTWFELMYGVNRIPEVAAYIHYAYSVNQPLLVSSLEEAYPEYDYTAFSPISQAEGLELARAALRGYTWGVEYFLPTKESLKPITGNLVYEDNKAAIQAWTAYDEGNLNRETNYATTTYPLDLSTVPDAADLPQGWANGLSLDSPFASGKAGSPLPFARGGKASPRDFARAMMAASATQRAMKFTLPPEGEGLDALGLLTSALAQTGLMGRVESLEDDFPAASLDEYYRTGQTPTAPVRFLREDIEKLSLLLPDISRIQVGDLLVHYGEEEGQSRDSFKLGIVVYAPMAGRPLPGQDASAYFKQVVILGVNEGERQVGLYNWLSNGTSRGFSEKPEGWQLRRLFAKPAPVTLLKSQTMGIMRSFGAEGIDPPREQLHTLIDSRINDLVFTYDSSYEATSAGSHVEERHPWMPNTGEYLILDQMRLKAKNEDDANIDLYSKWSLDDYIFLEFGAVDRFFDSAKTAAQYGNIYCNAGEGFEFVAFLPTDNPAQSEALKICNFLRIDGQAAYSTSFLDSDLYEYTSRPKEKTTKFRLVWNSIILLYKDKQLTRFGIRPIANDIRPGDDILLRVRAIVASDEYDGKPFFYSEKISEPKDFLSVYDKKLLWRANLYIDEGELKDWNNQYPWNAPASGGVTVATPKWWDTDWGNNEWNHGQGGIKEGNGRQIQLRSYTTIGSGDAPANVVSYDFPIGKDPQENLVTYFSIDSPFAYNRKIDQLMGWMGTKYTSNGQLRTANSPANDIWNKSLAPKNLWEEYFHSSEILNTALVKAFDNNSVYALPQVGLFFHYYIHDVAGDNLKSLLDRRLRDEVKIRKEDNSQIFLGEYLWNNGDDFKPWHIGTDCLGFAQRAASYLGAAYSWPKYLDDTNADIRQATPRKYPDNKKSDGTPWGDPYGIIVSDKNALEKLKYLVPGEIVTYDHGLHNSHIAVVQQIIFDPDGSVSPGNVKLIESYYSANGSINWVSIGRTLQDYTKSGWVWSTYRLKMGD